MASGVVTPPQIMLPFSLGESSLPTSPYMEMLRDEPASKRHLTRPVYCPLAWRTFQNAVPVRPRLKGIKRSGFDPVCPLSFCIFKELHLRASIYPTREHMSLSTQRSLHHQDVVREARRRLPATHQSRPQWTTPLVGDRS